MSRLILYKPTPEDIAEAFRRSKALGIPKSSVSRGKGRMTGFLGEIAFEKTFPSAKYVGGRSFTHDYEIGKLRVDIKSKKCSSRPMLHYTATVLATDPKKPLPADVYFFTRVLDDMSKVWLCGWVKNKVLQKPKYYKKEGETDNNGFTFRGNGYQIPIRLTRRPDSLLSECQISG